MSYRWRILAIAGLLAAGTACRSSRYSASAFSLPAGGDPVRGRDDVIALGCPACHYIGGLDLPKPTVQPPVPVMLGGEVLTRLSDAYLVTSIINPSYELASPYPTEQIAIDGKSRMPSYADRLTVQQLTDVVAFLQTRYWVTQRRIVPPLTMLVGGGAGR